MEEYFSVLDSVVPHWTEFSFLFCNSEDDSQPIFLPVQMQIATKIQ